MASAKASARNNASPSLPFLSLALLALLLAFAFDSMYGQLRRTGYLALVRSLVRPVDRALKFLPGSARPILRRYTGVAALDRLMITGNVIFANVADGSRPELSLYALQFGGQLVPAFGLVMVEGLRVGSGRNVLRGSIIWGFLIQSVGFGVIMPIYTSLHLLLTSNRAGLDAVHLRDHVRLHTIVPAFFFGYFFLSILAAFPFEDAAVRQWCNAVWQGFPLHVVLWQIVFAAAAKRISIGMDSGVGRKELEKRALGYAYQFVLVVGTITQWTTYAITMAAVFNPSLFPGQLAQALTPDKVFVPGSPHSYEPLSSAAVVIHDFLLYDQYIGCAALLVWSTTLAARAGRISVDAALAVRVLRNCLLVGPAGAAVLLMWQRDDAVLSEGETGK